MNEIDKLKTEHARYKKALLCVSAMYGLRSIAGSAADAALNPPPPPPVTLDEITTALRDKNCRDGGALHSIRFFGDESGHLYSEGARFYTSFNSLREALDILEA